MDDAKKAHDEAAEKIRVLLCRIADEMDARMHGPDTVHWGHVGDLTETCSRLDELVTFLGA